MREQLIVFQLLINKILFCAVIFLYGGKFYILQQL